MVEVRQLLNKGVDPNEIVEDYSLLHHAIRSGDAELVNTLVQNGADTAAPNCKKMAPIHFACEQKQNECLKMLIFNRADVNLKLANGCTPLFTAIAADNTEAVGILLENGADPNIQSSTNDLPIFLAVDRKNSEAVDMLLASGSQTSIGTKCAIILAIKRGDLESTRLILADHPDDEMCKDSRGYTPLEVSVGLKDPSFELLLLATHKPTKSIGEDFVDGIRDSILDDMAQQRDAFTQDPMTINNLPEFLDSVAVTEHTLWRFGELITLQSLEVRDKLSELREKAKNISPLEKSLNDLRIMWDAKIKETERRHKTLSTQVFTPESRAALQRWQQVLNDRKAFFDDLISKANSMSGTTTNIQEELQFYERMNDVLASYKNWENEQTKPYQAEIVEFTKKTQQALAPRARDPGMSDVFSALKALNDQIAETNPQLFEVKTTSRSASRAHSRRSKR